MFNLLHTFHPNPILISFGPITIYWYGLFIVLGIISALAISLKLANYYRISKNALIDITFWVIVGGVIGARIYHVFLELPFYLNHPLNIFKIWQGGLAIHGAIIVGLVITWFMAKKNKLNLLHLSALFVPGLALAQAIGRWGNYFNQELYGLPSNLPWSIPIDITNRLPGFYNFKFYHPTFLYESIGSLLIFFILIYLHYLKYKKQKNISSLTIVAVYLIAYSLLRFSLEFIRIDPTPEIAGWRWPQIISLFIILLMFILLYKKSVKDKKGLVLPNK